MVRSMLNRTETFGLNSGWDVTITFLPSGNILIGQNDNAIVVDARDVYDLTRCLGQWVDISDVTPSA